MSKVDFVCKNYSNKHIKLYFCSLIENLINGVINPLKILMNIKPTFTKG